LEIGLKFRIGKMELPYSPVEYVRSRVQLFGFSYVSLEDEVFLKVCDLPRHHGAPFEDS
jgi:PIN domain nuclease of toxin-antitoxin system